MKKTKTTLAAKKLGLKSHTINVQTLDRDQLERVGGAGKAAVTTYEASICNC